jgi:hypothetical protein
MPASGSYWVGTGYRNRGLQQLGSLGDSGGGRVQYCGPLLAPVEMVLLTLARHRGGTARDSFGHVDACSRIKSISARSPAGVWRRPA